MSNITLSRLSLSVSVFALSTAFSAPALAQTPPTPSDQPGAPPCAKSTGSPNGLCTSGEVKTAAGEPATPKNPNAIVVTGSRIRRPNLESPVPITSISQDELTNQGQVSVGDALNDLPALRSTFSQQNSGRFIGTAGQNFLDLRGLGTNRTLVLVNGRRMITAAPGSFDVDVDNIPQDLIDRIDVVTGGESAIYGSDAVAGVVNFILKKDFDGFRIRGQGGISQHNDRPVDFVSTTMGRNFAGGRGNIAVNLEYTHAGELFFRDRKDAANVCGFEPNPADNGGANDPTTASGDSTNGVPDNVFVCGLRNPFVTLGGSIGLLTLSGQTLSFDPTGNLVVTPPADQSFIGVGGIEVSNNTVGGATLRETGDLAVGRDRYSASLVGHFDVSNAFKPFIEGMYVRQRVEQEGQPSFFQGRLSSFFGPIVPSLKCTNAFLTQQNLDVLHSFGLCGSPTSTIPLNRFNVDLGARKEIDRRTVYRIVGGVTGDFNKGWHYEVSVNYGHHHADNAQLNDLQIADENGNPAGFALAVDAVRDANGNIVCRSTLTNPGNGCVPIDLFGEGRASPAAIAFVNRTSHLFQTASQLDIQGFVSGDSSQLFSLQGGPVGFSVGAEYRRETAESHADPVSAAGGTFFNAFPEFDPPAFTVREFFGELNAPILKDLPFAKELTISGAVRQSHYNTSAGNTFAWNANAIWSPVRDLRLRGNYSKSVRVPTLGDLFTPPTVNFGSVQDPCDQQFINANPNRAANCAALGVPTTVTSVNSPCFSATQNGFFGPVGSPFHNCLAQTQTIEFTSAGNPNLKSETGKSVTIGGVLTPRSIPGFSVSVDYFDIRVTNLISVLGAQTILNLCVNQSSINNQFCQLISARDQFGLLQSPALVSAGVNFAKQVSRGIDFDLSYSHRFSNGNRLNLRGFATYTLERTDFTDPNFPAVGDRILSELGDPVFSGTAIAGYSIGRFGLRYTLRYIGSMTDFAFEDTHAFPPACDPVSGACPPFNSDVADRINTGAVWYHDLRLDYTDNKYNFYVGVDNLFNKLPPLGLTGAGAGSGIYSDIGRFFYAGATLNFK
jgi:outer membrane receptor protein involved in Fe transport